MAIDKREDAGQFYPGGSVVPRGPVTPGGGGTPSDYPTVRTNAATGAAHAAETGNPHATTAEQVGVRVVELVVEDDAKKLYLMLNGERTTERVTSYAELLAMAKRGLVRLYYNAVGGTGRKALYTPHMVDDNGTPAMRFDATGTLGVKVYTRSIALTKSGTDGIVVTIGELTEIQKALTQTQLNALNSGLDSSYKTLIDNDLINRLLPCVLGEAFSMADLFLMSMIRISEDRIRLSGDIRVDHPEHLRGENPASVSDINEIAELTPFVLVADGEITAAQKDALDAVQAEFEQPQFADGDWLMQPVTVTVGGATWRFLPFPAPGAEPFDAFSLWPVEITGPTPEDSFYVIPTRKRDEIVHKGDVEHMKAGGLTDAAIAGVFATPAFSEGVATALDEQGAKDKITKVAEATITNKAMPTEGAVEGSVVARIVALEAGGGGGGDIKYDPETDEIYVEFDKEA